MMNEFCDKSLFENDRAEGRKFVMPEIEIYLIIVKIIFNNEKKNKCF